jgi:hypothetical protein
MMKGMLQCRVISLLFISYVDKRLLSATKDYEVDLGWGSVEAVCIEASTRLLIY